MATALRKLVSQNKVRTKLGEFDLDLTYITPRIIAMSFPSEGAETLFRNPMTHVVKFLDENHWDKYMVFNLCEERCYDKGYFHGRVVCVGFEDHGVPLIDTIEKFCLRVDEWFSANRENVIVVHCKAGKGRTGTMIACYLLHSNLFNINTVRNSMIVLPSSSSPSMSSSPTAAPPMMERKYTNPNPVPRNYRGRSFLYDRNDQDEIELTYVPTEITSGLRAIHYFNQMRTQDGNGIAVPSQRRYIGYYEQILKDPARFRKFKHMLRLKLFRLEPVPHFHLDRGCDPTFKIMQDNELVFDSQKSLGIRHFSIREKVVELNLPEPLSLCGDIKVVFFHHDLLKDEEMFHFCFNTAFHARDHDSSLILFKHELDKALKDRSGKRFDDGFHISLIFDKTTTTTTVSSGNSSQQSQPTSAV